MKEAWVLIDVWSKEMVTTAIEGGADALIVPPGWETRIKDLGRVTTISRDGDLVPGQDVFFERLFSPEDEGRIAQLLKKKPVVLDDEPEGEPPGRDSPNPPCRTWEVIPTENLVAHGGRLFVPVYTQEDARLALGILEKGVTGVVIHASDPATLKTLLAGVKTSSEKITLKTATVEAVLPVGLGDRVCIDSCSLMTEGEGMLVGNSSSFLFLVQAEAKENPYVAPRPFRVNAGPVHAYVRVVDGRTRYLSELQSGDPLLIVHAQGSTQPATAGRIKIERRPLLLIHASCEDDRGSILVQNAETIRLTGVDGAAVSVVQLKPGDHVLVAIEESGRHFGVKVDETIWEK